MRIFFGSISEESCDFDGRCCLDAFTSSDGERSGLVGPSDPPRAFRAIAAHAFRSPECFIAKLRVTNPSITNRDEHLSCDSEYVQSMMRKNRCVRHG